MALGPKYGAQKSLRAFLPFLKTRCLFERKVLLSAREPRAGACLFLALPQKNTRLAPIQILWRASITSLAPYPLRGAGHH